MMIIMRVRDEELTQKLIALDAAASLATMVNKCRSYEATRTATTAIRAPPSKLCAVSTYKKIKGHGNRGSHSLPTPNKDTLCPSCTRKHSSTGKCLASDSVCVNCGCKGHWRRTPKCLANKATCRHCGRVGHYDNYCCQQMNANQGSPPNATPPSSKPSNCRKVETPSSSTDSSPPPISISLTYRGETSKLMMLPDTGADVSVMGPQHLELLHIPRSELQPPATSVTLTADGSKMTLALGTLKATLSLAKRSCLATIQVNECIQMPLLSYALCKELAIIPPGFPQPILQATHVNRCKELPLHADMTPAEAREYFLQTFQDVLVSKEDLKAAPLRPMAGPPMKIHLKEDAVPFAIHTPRQIPYAFCEPVKNELDSMVQQGIIKPCGDEPLEWCHPLVVVPKAKGVRIMVDLTKLNAQISRPPHPSPTPLAAVRTIDSTAKFSTTADALHGYWQMELAEEDRHLTTFITPYGCFQHCQGPMGFAATGDAYCYCGDLALQGMKKCVKVVDDILIFNEDLLTHYHRIHEYSLLSQKWHHSQQRKVHSGRDQNRCISPLRDMPRSPPGPWIWTSLSSPVRSQFLADAETRYATIELEMLAVSWALTKSCLYLKGLPTFTLQTDHRPLVPIINSYTLDMVENPRLQRMKERMSQYQFTAVWCAGKSLCIPDALSRAPVSYPTSDHL
ncbi:uncharacterized protein LOC135211412 [Macrobrachium nipponense]|uniref:uncharacterized protein LOC135211412 n=1 Tax=Macrobrachium nipponense TaxID=159736 RepID=UPI0030C89ABE